MHRFLKLAVAAATATAALCAQAAVYDAKFTGTVDAQTDSGFALNALVSGEFVYDTVNARFLKFTVGGQSAPIGAASQADITPDHVSAIYKAQVSPVTGGSVNSSFVLDLEALGIWPTTDAAALLGDVNQLATNLDTSGFSNFGYYTADADGNNLRSLSATLSSFAVSEVPEPASLALVVLALAGMGLSGVRRHR